MKFRNFSVSIPEGNEISNGYVEMEHGKSFGIFISNMIGLRSDVVIEYNGKKLTELTLDSYGSKTIKHYNVDDVAKPFTYYKLGTKEATSEKIHLVPDKYLGLLKVTFIPELITVQEPPSNRIYKNNDYMVRPLEVTPIAKNTDGSLAVVVEDSLEQETPKALVRNYELAANLYLRLIPVPEVEPLSETNVPFNSFFPPVLK